MKASLGLKADQENDWASFEAAVRDAAKARARPAKRKKRRLITDGSQPGEGDRIAQGQASLEKIVDAAQPL